MAHVVLMSIQGCRLFVGRSIEDSGSYLLPQLATHRANRVHGGPGAQRCDIQLSSGRYPSDRHEATASDVGHWTCQVNGLARCLREEFIGCIMADVMDEAVTYFCTLICHGEARTTAARIVESGLWQTSIACPAECGIGDDGSWWNGVGRLACRELSCWCSLQSQCARRMPEPARSNRGIH